MLVQHAINLGIFTLLFFFLGMYKPKWPMFFLEKPSRWHIMIGTTILFMIVMTMYGEGVKQDKLKMKHSKPAVQNAAPPPAPVPVPVPVPAPVETPKKK